MLRRTVATLCAGLMAGVVAIGLHTRGNGGRSRASPWLSAGDNEAARRWLRAALQLIGRSGKYSSVVRQLSFHSVLLICVCGIPDLGHPPGPVW